MLQTWPHSCKGSKCPELPTLSGYTHLPGSEGSQNSYRALGASSGRGGQQMQLHLQSWGTRPAPRASSQREAPAPAQHCNLQGKRGRFAQIDPCFPPAEALSLWCPPLSLKLPDNQSASFPLSVPVLFWFYDCFLASFRKIIQICSRSTFFSRST